MHVINVANAMINFISPLKAHAAAGLSLRSGEIIADTDSFLISKSIAPTLKEVFNCVLDTAYSLTNKIVIAWRRK